MKNEACNTSVKILKMENCLVDISDNTKKLNVGQFYKCITTINSYSYKMIYVSDDETDRKYGMMSVYFTANDIECQALIVSANDINEIKLASDENDLFEIIFKRLNFDIKKSAFVDIVSIKHMKNN